MEIGFGDEYGELVLLDASNEEIRKALESGESLVLKGGSEQDAILCTSTSTFQLFSRETSNELLFVRPQRGEGKGDSIEGVAHQFLEPIRIPPRMDQLKLLLTQNAARLAEEEEDISSIQFKRMKSGPEQRLMLDELVASVQASREEILQGLDQLFAYEDETVGWISPNKEVMGNVITQFLLCLVAHSVNEPAVLQSDQVCDWLSEFPPGLVRAILFGSRARDSIDLNRVLLFKAESLLRGPTAAAPVPLQGFLANWAESVSPLTLPKEEESALAMLREFSLVANNEIRYFARDALPRNAKARLQVLFDTLPFWREQDMEFYLHGVEGGSASAKTRFCRISKQGDAQGFVKKM